MSGRRPPDWSKARVDTIFAPSRVIDGHRYNKGQVVLFANFLESLADRYSRAETEEIHLPVLELSVDGGAQSFTYSRELADVQDLVLSYCLKHQVIGFTLYW